MKLFSPRLRAQIIKELLSFLRDPKARVILIVPPLIQLLVFSFAVTLEVKNASISIYDRDQGYWSAELIHSLRKSSFVGKIQFAQNQNELHEQIERRKSILAIEIPDTFSKDIAQGKTAAYQVIIDGRRANSGQIALGYLQNITAALGLKSADLITVQHWFNPNLIYLWFVVPGFVAMMSAILALIVTALSIARERELGTFNQLLVSPCTPGEIIIAKTLPALMIASTVGMIMVAAAIFIFNIPCHGSLLLLYAMMLLFILSVVGIGLMISSISSTQQQAILGTFSVIVPMVLMSGFATPVENMPEILQWLAQAIPLKHFLIIVQGTFLRNMSAIEAWNNAWPLIVIAIVTLSLATLMVRSRLQ